MLRFTVLRFVFVLMLSATIAGVFAQSTPGGSKEPSRHPEIERQMRKMYEKDQAIRTTYIEEQKKGVAADRLKKMIGDWKEIDHANTARMKEWVDRYGWLGASLVGRWASHAAWLFVQHADAEPKFQRRCLDLMAPLVISGEVDKADFAYLTDRVLIAEGKRQLYGTQFTTDKNGEMGPQPIEDEAHVDARRKEIGLTPLAQYAAELRKIYGKPSKRKGT